MKIPEKLSPTTFHFLTFNFSWFFGVRKMRRQKPIFFVKKKIMKNERLGNEKLLAESFSGFFIWRFYRAVELPYHIWPKNCEFLGGVKKNPRWWSKFLFNTFPDEIIKNPLRFVFFRVKLVIPNFLFFEKSNRCC